MRFLFLSRVDAACWMPGPPQLRAEPGVGPAGLHADALAAEPVLDEEAADQLRIRAQPGLPDHPPATVHDAQGSLLQGYVQSAVEHDVVLQSWGKCRRIAARLPSLVPSVCLHQQGEVTPGRDTPSRRHASAGG